MKTNLLVKALAWILLASNALSAAELSQNSNNKNALLSTNKASSNGFMAIQYYGGTDFIDSIRYLDGEWYSPEWKYGYRMKNGVGVATYSNSPYFSPGDRIIFLSFIDLNDFRGQQVYRDGRFYNIRGRLIGGKLCINGEKNVSWCMVRIGR